VYFFEFFIFFNYFIVGRPRIQIWAMVSEYALNIDGFLANFK